MQHYCQVQLRMLPCRNKCMAVMGCCLREQKAFQRSPDFEPSPKISVDGGVHGLSLGGAKCLDQTTTSTKMGNHTSRVASIKETPRAPKA